MAKTNNRSPRFAGLDLSPNHAAYREIDENGRHVFFNFVTDKPSVHKAFPEVSHLFHAAKSRKDLDKPDHKLKRLIFMGAWLDVVLSRRPFRLAIEGYAYNKRTGAYDIGEIGGLARLKMAELDIPFQIITPGEVKSYAGIKGKEKPIRVCYERYGVDWSVYNAGTKTADAAGDLADADILAHMCLADHLIKSGKLKPDKKHVMQRISKRPWLTG